MFVHCFFLFFFFINFLVKEYLVLLTLSFQHTLEAHRIKKIAKTRNFTVKFGLLRTSNLLVNHIFPCKYFCDLDRQSQ